MENLVIIAQIAVALSVCYVWIFRFDNIVIEFKQYGLPNVVRNMVGASKIALATLMNAGIWYRFTTIFVIINGIFDGLRTNCTLQSKKSILKAFAFFNPINSILIYCRGVC